MKNQQQTLNINPNYYTLINGIILYSKLLLASKFDTIPHKHSKDAYNKICVIR